MYPILSGKKRECIVYTHLFQFSEGHSIIMFSQNDQKLNLPPCLHLFHFVNSLPANVQTFTSNPNYHHHHYLPVTKTRGETFRSLLVTFCLLLVIFCSLLVTFRLLLVTFCTVLLARCLLLFTCYSLLFACCSLLFARRSLLFTRCSTSNSEGFFFE